LLAAMLSAAAWHVFRRENEGSPAGHAAPADSWASATRNDGPAKEAPVAPAPASTPAASPDAPPAHPTAEVATLAFAYGISGFGYIVTATFLPVIARAAIVGSPLIDLFWPIFGAGVVCGALLASRLPPVRDQRLRLAAAYVIQAIGIGVGVAWPTEVGFAFGSLLLGLPFTAITFFAMREARRLRPAAPASAMGLLTALYGIGQIVGPPLVALLLKRSTSAGQGFALSLQVAAAALVAGAAIYLATVRAYPLASVRAA